MRVSGIFLFAVYIAAVIMDPKNPVDAGKCMFLILSQIAIWFASFSSALEAYLKKHIEK